MEVPNISLLFNKVIFKRLDKSDLFKNKTKEIHQKLFTLPLNLQHVNLLDIKNQGLIPNKNRVVGTFDLTTTWPGLLIGLGYGHSTGNSDDEFKNGFYFDFTTGLPILPGSTVKGILRSYFPDRYDILVEDKKLRKEVLLKKNNILKRLISILNSLDIEPNKSLVAGNVWNEETIKELENIIFEGKNSDSKISSNIQDVFFDSFPQNAGKSNVLEGNIAREYDGVFLGEDTITPHKHPLKNPLPLRFLKILQGVTFHFQFYLNDKGISSENKIKLFEELLIRFGAGSKSSVGFGKFVKEPKSDPEISNDWFIGFQPLRKKIWEEDEQDEHEVPIINNTGEKPTLDPPIQECEDWMNPEEIKKGNIVKATVLSSLNGNLKIRLHVKKINITQNLQSKGEKNSIIDVKVQNTEGNINKGNFTIKVIPSK